MCTMVKNSVCMSVGRDLHSPQLCLGDKTQSWACETPLLALGTKCTEDWEGFYIVSISLNKKTFTGRNVLNVKELFKLGYYNKCKQMHDFKGQDLLKNTL